MIATAAPRPALGGFAVAAAIILLGLVIAANAGRDLFRPATAGVAFLAGLVTGSHCIGMCGGFVLCYTAGRSRGPRAHLTYGAAKTLSYIGIGALCGALGQAISAHSRLPGIAALVAGVFLLALGIHLLGWPIWPARFRLARLDRTATWLRERARRSASPLGLGLANGLMLGCGPLLAMYAAAAGTGSALEGAALLGAFGLGTLPVMMASAWIASALVGNFQRHLASWSGPLVLLCGLLMLQRGFALASPAPARPPLATAPTAAFVPQLIRMTASAHAWSPAHFVLQKNIPVRWVIDSTHVSTCTERLRIPSLQREIELRGPETIIEFTPTQSGELLWSCWMGMARGRFTVVESPPDEPAISAASAPSPGPAKK